MDRGRGYGDRGGGKRGKRGREAGNEGAGSGGRGGGKRGDRGRGVCKDWGKKLLLFDRKLIENCP